MESVVVHCHFYQPPRENPWTSVVPAEPGAAPFHDWNARIAHECYEPFAAAQVLDAAGEAAGTINLYEWVSFDAGPTLLRWLESHSPGAYHAMCDADRASALRLDGHGNAIASPYDHVILPLASRRDKVMEVRWGLADFRRRFGREAEGFWLPETAVDEETLVVLAEEGVRFTILAPHQVEDADPDGLPMRFSAGGGKEIAVFLYDGTLAHDAAFERLLDDGEEFARRLTPTGHAAAQRASRRVASVALDGETFGHHRKFAEMALACAVKALNAEQLVRIENFASVLAHTAPARDLVLVDPSSWSCVHGIERWRSNCTCGIVSGASHAWRRPLRAALNWLARDLDAHFTGQSAGLFTDAWSALEAFGAVAGLGHDQRLAFVAERVAPQADAARALAVLDAMRARFGMFGSCAWFFDDATGHEVELMLRLAAFATQTLGAPRTPTVLIERLALARDAAPLAGDAASVYRERVLALRDASA